MRPKIAPKTRKKTAARTGPRKRAAGSSAGEARRAAKADAIDALVAASAQALGLPIDPAWEYGIRFNLELNLRLARLIDEFPLPDDIEPGSVFRA